jgi:hypothetical protein
MVGYDVWQGRKRPSSDALAHGSALQLLDGLRQVRPLIDDVGQYSIGSRALMSSFMIPGRKGLGAKRVGNTEADITRRSSLARLQRSCGDILTAGVAVRSDHISLHPGRGHWLSFLQRRFADGLLRSVQVREGGEGGCSSCSEMRATDHSSMVSHRSLTPNPLSETANMPPRVPRARLCGRSASWCSRPRAFASLRRARRSRENRGCASGAPASRRSSRRCR